MSGSSEKVPNRHSLQLVASIAATLLADDDYPTAAKRAIGLLDACETEINNTWAEQTGILISTSRKLIKFDKAIRQITGQRTETGALPLYKRYLMTWCCRELGAPVESDIEPTDPRSPTFARAIALIENYQQNGFPEANLELEKRGFKDWRKEQTSQARSVSSKKRKKFS